MEPQVTKEFHLSSHSGCQVSILEMRGANTVQLILLDHGGQKHTATFTQGEFEMLVELRWHINWGREPKPEPDFEPPEPPPALSPIQFSRLIKPEGHEDA